MIRKRWQWPAITLLSATAACFANFTIETPDNPLKLIILLWFLLIFPGMGFVHLVKIGDVLLEWTLAIALSLSIDAAIAGIFLYATKWSPINIFITLLVISVIGAITNFFELPQDVADTETSSTTLLESLQAVISHPTASLPTFGTRTGPNKTIAELPTTAHAVAELPTISHAIAKQPMPAHAIDELPTISHAIARRPPVTRQSTPKPAIDELPTISHTVTRKPPVTRQPTPKPAIDELPTISHTVAELPIREKVLEAKSSKSAATEKPYLRFSTKQPMSNNTPTTANEPAKETQPSVAQSAAGSVKQENFDVASVDSQTAGAEKARDTDSKQVHKEEAKQPAEEEIKSNASRRLRHVRYKRF